MITIIPDYITKEGEQHLISVIRQTNLARGKERNSITRYGSRLPYDYPTHPKIPSYFLLIAEMLVHDNYFLPQHTPDHVTVNEYHKGQSIDWHIDSPTSGPTIAVLSLISPATMGLKNDTIIHHHILPPRSLLIMTDEERWEWKHCIFPVQQKRISVVFRKGELKPIPAKN